MSRAVWSPPAGETRDLALHVRLAGAGPPAILLLHGLAGSNQYFGAAFDALARDARLAVPDLLGFGGSPRPEPLAYGPDDHARALVELLEQLAVPAPIWIGAHSAGVLAALRLARLRPEWVRGIAAFGPPLYPSPEAARACFTRLGLRVRLFAMDTRIARSACGWMCSHRPLAARLFERLRPDLPAPIARAAVDHSYASFSGTLQNLIICGEGAGDLAALRIPVALVAGDRDAALDLDFLRELARTRPGVTLEIWPGGHDLPLANPQRCIGLIRRLMAH